MSFLADTHTLLWWLAGKAGLSPASRDLLSDTTQPVFVSAATAWEITTKFRLGKLPEAGFLAGNVENCIRLAGFRALPVTMAHAELAGRMPGEHRDPFDRMLAAQALLESFTLISADTALDAFGVRRLW